jgi:hypothetical protein
VRVRSSLFALGLLAAFGPARAAVAEGVPAALLPPTLKKLSPEQASGLSAALLAELQSLALFELKSTEVVERTIAKLQAQKIYTDGCLEQTACTRRVGGALQAVWLFHLAAGGSLGGVTVNVRSFDARTGELIRHVGRFAGEGPGELERAVLQAVRLAAGPVLAASQPGQARLALQLSPGEAEILVDGAACPACAEPAGAALASGVVELVVRRAGCLPFAEVVVLRPGQEVRLPVALEPTPEARRAREEAEAEAAEAARVAARRATESPPPPEPASEAPAWWQRWWFWTALGAVLAGGLGAGLYFGLRDPGPQGSGGIQVGWE